MPASTPPLISIIFPIKKQSPFTQESLQSIFQQTYSNLEILIIDCSSDKSVSNTLNKAVDDSRVLIAHSPHANLSVALSLGFAIATGDFITWIQDTSLMEKKQIEVLLEFLLLHPELEMTYGNYYLVDEKNSTGDRLRGFLRPIELPETTENLNSDSNFIGPCFLMSRFASKVLGSHLNLPGVEDYDYWMRMNNLFGIRRIKKRDFLLKFYPKTSIPFDDQMKVIKNLQILMKHEENRGLYMQTAEIYANPFWCGSNLDCLQIANKINWNLVTDDEISSTEFTLNLSPSVINVLLIGEPRGLDDYVKRHFSERLESLCTVAIVDSKNWNPVHVHKSSTDLTTVDLVMTNSAQLYHTLSLYHKNVFGIVHNWIEKLEVEEWFEKGKHDRTQNYLVIKWNHAIRTLIKPFCTNLVAERLSKIQQEKTSLQLVLRESKPYVQQKVHVLLHMCMFYFGGMENMVLDLASVLLKQGNRVTLAITGPTNPSIHKMLQKTAPGASLWIMDDVLQGSQNTSAIFDKYLNSDVFEYIFERMLTTRKIHVVNSHYCEFGAKIVGKLGIPLVQTMHNSYVWLSNVYQRTMRNNEKYISAYAAISSSVAMYSHVAIGLPARKMVILPNGAPENKCLILESKQAWQEWEVIRTNVRKKIGVSSGDTVMMIFGALRRQKGQKHAVRALAKIKQSAPKQRFKLLFVGNKEDVAYFQEIQGDLKQLNLSTEVTITGKLPRDEAHTYIAASDIMLFPSTFEGHSLSMLEALCFGNPIITTDTGGARDLAFRVNTAINMNSKSQHTLIHIIDPPIYKDITKYDSSDFEDLYGDDNEFVERLADIILHVYKQIRLDKDEMTVLDKVINRFSSAVTYSYYDSLFRWLIRKGSLSSFRAWLE